MKFIPPTEYIRLCKTDWEDKIAFVLIPVGASRPHCISYLQEMFCGFLKSPWSAVNILRALGDHAPKTGRLIHITLTAEFVYATRGSDEVKFVESFKEGDVLYCARSWVHGDDVRLPKELFTGDCTVVTTEVDY